MVPLSVEDTGHERDDSADEDDWNARCEQSTKPDADRFHFGKALEPDAGVSEFRILLCLWFTISLHLTAAGGCAVPAAVRLCNGCGNRLVRSSGLRDGVSRTHHTVAVWGVVAAETIAHA